MNANRHLLMTPLRMSCGLGLTAAALLVASSTDAGASTTPQLSIAVDSSRTSAAVGDLLPYAITVRNLGGTAITGLKISQSVPTGLRFKSADLAGTAHPLSIEWSVNLKAGGTATVHSTMTVTKTPPELLRLATVACARSIAKAPPIVCAASSAQLPAGAAAERAAAQPPDRNATKTVYVAGAGGALAIGAAVVIITRRRRHKPA
ncbi:DUF11 domain-containing protein [Kribbella kalugense]|uniref:Putative repeat protein (TIGR01451 family) n=1 Tax=Kribbella kalugense TaxID=2512221 RepID=A0A4R8A413_9ACTN|nr:DUF11 domain-containing protein [Kribbella kalugense]TDW24391.1 putative repeat protein (TIGR01451 family) [Kribbella kalugense]